MRSNDPPIKAFAQKSNGRAAPWVARSRRTTIDPLWVIFLLTLLGGVKGQTTNATCFSTNENKWMFNNAGESPCAVWSKVQSLCIPQTSYINVPPLLDQSYSYNLPNGGSSGCQCNTVSYSLMSACALCQYPSASLPSEQDWSGNCRNYANDGLGFDTSVLSIPAFAYHQWSGSTFDQDQAKSSTATGPPAQSYTTTLSRTFPSSTLSSSSNTSNTSSPSTSSPDAEKQGDEKSVSWGPILGGAAGGLVLLVVLILLIRWFVTRNNPKPKSKLKNDRIPYPYGGKEGGGYDQDDSFLEMLNSTKPRSRSMSISRPKSLKKERKGKATQGEAREEMLKRRTAELMSDPSSFAHPRTAPLPFTPLSQQPADPPTPKIPLKAKNRSIRFTTDSTHLQRPDSTSSSVIERPQEKVLIPPRQRYSVAFSDSSSESGGILSPQDFHQSESAFRSRSISPLPPARVDPSSNVERRSMAGSLSMDFSSSRPLDLDRDIHKPGQEKRPDSEVATLPSLYEPAPAARTYRRSEAPSQIISPESTYPMTGRTSTSKYPESQYSYTLDEYPPQETLLRKLNEHRRISGTTSPDGTIGAALGSGKRGSYWRESRWSGTSASLSTAGR
ncbi:hypothetical protein I302_102643 [Kwoniella bestiolae CBS 10118]|uniref:Uncharacterized protein n=1 Tax=Kwoniella bestiolae CBS 10118 TaxID=1296100 RepID=A0A1B9GFJ7_9TREE|nr:hypothetical protein I302_01333 [Kwoniella bestiolae CBS 10118]OCF29820.1 hypothetical protein I302_01333 [Kwoniella bestiolae CBS 10118]